MLISIKTLNKTYHMGAEVVEALKDVSLNIEKNEYVALMGPSGSGKSTLMNLLGCLDSPTRGEYWLNGTEVSTMDDGDLAEKKRVRLDRLRAHIARLRADVAAGKEPDSP